MKFVLDDFDYDLPPELIAQTPAPQRGQSRMMVLERRKQTLEHAQFSDIVRYFSHGDALVLNDTKVRAARLFGLIGERSAEVLLVERIAQNRYLIKGRPGRKMRPGTELVFPAAGLRARIVDSEAPLPDGMKKLQFEGERDVEELLDAVGAMPLPPYIKRPSTAEDAQRYQTVYARKPGAIAAPTAGLHFSPALLSQLEQRQVRLIYVTLHIGIGTFAAVKETDITRHTMHEESYEVSAEAAQAIETVKRRGGKICAVGTTSCRVLESCAGVDAGDFRIRPGAGKTRIFMYPPYAFKAVDMLLTNFHLPRTTLLMLVHAFGGHDFLKRAYAEAVSRRYRFFSYGDCMLIT
ncbi:MAG: tRNA preQ1(34) S-adenosylmethionine ribosyltransferase-isomerase QueA [Candidatus Omnitrophica bacterium]|nr:tRNA preQ1(34) S-adenosylmethionine ribosyltransferase-isomerase QueA [Candidatus Omnitrophota bacterium]